MNEKTKALIDAARLRVVGRENPKLEAIPDWVVEWRPQQKDAVKRIVDAFGEHDVVVLDAPTGSGKTLIAETVRRMLGVRGLYVCNSIHLQHQFARDFPYSSLMKGRGNYKPQRVWGDVTCADCNKKKVPKIRDGKPVVVKGKTIEEWVCSLCDNVGACPYEVAKGDALDNDIAVLNTTYFLTEGNGPGRFGGSGLVVLDEADTLEQELMRYAGIRIGRRTVERYALGEPAKVTVADSWRDWISGAIPKLRDGANKIRGDDVDKQRQRDNLRRLASKLQWIDERMGGRDGTGWVYTGKNGVVEFKPVRVDELAKSLLWGLGKKFLLMSASIISAGALLDDLGWDRSYGTVSLGSTFPVSNRPVRIQTVANVTTRGGSDERTKLIAGIRRVADEHADERILIHSVSYDLTREIVGASWNGRPVISYNNSDEKAVAIAKARRSSNSIIVAPSFERGVDLPDELCRVIIVAKVPYPYLGDRQVNARLYGKGGRTWYSVQTVRTIVQMTGRGVRHDQDWCVSYVLDSQFKDLWNNARGLFPQWWVDALVWA